VFLSHSSRDRLAVEAVRAQVLAVGVRPYLFEYDQRPGEPLASKLLDAIDGSAAMVVLITANTASSPPVHQEIGAAVARGKLIIALVENGHHDQLTFLKDVEYVPFDRDDPREAMES